MIETEQLILTPLTYEQLLKYAKCAFLPFILFLNYNTYSMKKHVYPVFLMFCWQPYRSVSLRRQSKSQKQTGIPASIFLSGVMISDRLTRPM